MGATEERIFHDRAAADIHLDSLLVFETFEAATAPENRFIMALLGDISGKKVLDLACGAGESSVYFALKGAEVTALDVSPEMVKLASLLAAKYEVLVKGVVSDVAQLPFDKSEFDIVYGNGVLHHFLDKRTALLEIKRVLRTGGKAVFIEPLAHNPVINIYRRIAREVRTEDEKPFKLPELESLMHEVFGNGKHEEFWLLTLWLFIRFYLIERVDPNKERYWKKIIRDHKRLTRLYDRLERLDNKLLAAFPSLLKRYCWNTVVYGIKL